MRNGATGHRAMKEVEEHATRNPQSTIRNRNRKRNRTRKRNPSISIPIPIPVHVQARGRKNPPAASSSKLYFTSLKLKGGGSVRPEVIAIKLPWVD